MCSHQPGTHNLNYYTRLETPTLSFEHILDNLMCHGTVQGCDISVIVWLHCVSFSLRYSSYGAFGCVGVVVSFIHIIYSFIY